MESDSVGHSGFAFSLLIREPEQTKPQSQGSANWPRRSSTARAATSDEVKDLRREASALKEVVRTKAGAEEALAMLAAHGWTGEVSNRPRIINAVGGAIR
jgi:hypothetical protein